MRREWFISPSFWGRGDGPVISGVHGNYDGLFWALTAQQLVNHIKARLLK